MLRHPDKFWEVAKLYSSYLGPDAWKDIKRPEDTDATGLLGILRNWMAFDGIDEGKSKKCNTSGTISYTTRLSWSSTLRGLPVQSATSGRWWRR
jgi:hypothetical protein